MINEREASRKFFRKESIISSHKVNEEEKTSIVYHIENLKQLRDWMREDSEVISFMIQELRKNNNIIISEYYMMIEKHDHLFDLYQALLNKIVNQNEDVSIEFIHDKIIKLEDYFTPSFFSNRGWAPRLWVGFERRTDSSTQLNPLNKVGRSNPLMSWIRTPTSSFVQLDDHSTDVD
jgi:hypothetical protein